MSEGGGGRISKKSIGGGLNFSEIFEGGGRISLKFPKISILHENAKKNPLKKEFMRLFDLYRLNFANEIHLGPTLGKNPPSGFALGRIFCLGWVLGEFQRNSTYIG